jgi:methylglutaconyl-CoA hydratase
VVSAIWGLPVPTLAIVQGPAMAGGVGLVAACDLVVASEAASFALPEPKRGLTAAMVTPVLVHRVGSAAAGSLLLSGRAWDALTALRRGLCDDVVPADGLTIAADELIASVLTGAPQALAITKANWRAWSAPHVLKQLEEAVTASAKARETDDAQEGRQAFLEKRDPRWVLKP